MQHGRVAYLEKEPGECDDALKFRHLVLLPALYRRWASARLEALREWTSMWALPSIYAGAEPQGPTEATYHIGTHIELAELLGEAHRRRGDRYFKSFRSNAPPTDLHAG